MLARAVVLVSICCTLLGAGSAHAAAPVKFEHTGTEQSVDVVAAEGDWIIGDDPADETVELTGNESGKSRTGAIFVLNQGRLILRDIGAPGFRLEGPIYLQDEAQLQILNSQVLWKEPRDLSPSVLYAKDHATLVVDNSEVETGGLERGMGFFYFFDNCHLAIRNGSNIKGKTQYVLSDHCVGVLDSSFGVYETYGGEETNWTFRNIQPVDEKDGTVYYWMRFTDGVTGVLNDLPELSSEPSHITKELKVGGFTASFSDVNVQAWAVHSNPGSDVTVDFSRKPDKGRGSKLVVGMQVRQSFAAPLPAVSTMAINTADLSNALSDRKLRIVDSYLLTCQVWAGGSEQPTHVVLSPGAIIGEGACGQNVLYTGAKVCVDGSGGLFHIGGNGKTHFTEGSSFGRPEVPWGCSVIVSEAGELVIEDGSFLTPNSTLTVSETGLAWLADSYMENWDNLTVHDDGRVRIAWLKSPEENDTIEGTVSVVAVVDSRTASGSDLKQWSLAARREGETATTEIASGDSGAFPEQELATWDTANLESGRYELLLRCEDGRGAFELARAVAVR